MISPQFYSDLIANHPARKHFLTVFSRFKVNFFSSESFFPPLSFQLASFRCCQSSLVAMTFSQAKNPVGIQHETNKEHTTTSAAVILSCHFIVPPHIKPAQIAPAQSHCPLELSSHRVQSTVSNKRYKVLAIIRADCLAHEPIFISHPVQNIFKHVPLQTDLLQFGWVKSASRTSISLP